jgi:hypothetical protein
MIVIMEIFVCILFSLGLLFVSYYWRNGETVNQNQFTLFRDEEKNFLVHIDLFEIQTFSQ